MNTIVTTDQHIHINMEIQELIDKYRTKKVEYKMQKIKFDSNTKRINLSHEALQIIKVTIDHILELREELIKDIVDDLKELKQELKQEKHGIR